MDVFTIAVCIIALVICGMAVWAVLVNLSVK